jgi:PKD repeat protein
MKRKIGLLICLIISLKSFAQEEECGTIVTPENIEFLKNKFSQSTLMSNDELSLIRIPITPHIIRKSDGSGGLGENAFQAAIFNVNNYYKNSGIEFFINDQINYIDDDDYYDLSSTQETNLGTANDVSGTINVYFSNTLKSTTALCGYTYLPPSADRVFVANGCISGGTFEHELGHYFSLFHTHGTTNNGTTNEFVDGSNCTTAGDFICDTPADPNLSGRVTNCQYSANIFDSNGDLYSPMVNNLMSYAPGNCRDAFTPGQYERIRRGFEDGRVYLNFETAEFTARFTSDKEEVCEGEKISFTHNTPLATSFKWTFEGGSPNTSSQPNPKITYENEGNYSVKLEAFAGGGLTSVIEEQEYIQVINPLENSTDENFITGISGQDQFDSDFSVINEDLGFTFEYSHNDAQSSQESGSIVIHHFDYISDVYPNIDYLNLPKYEISGIKGFDFSFSVAYSPTEQRSDSLFLAIRYDCEKEWQIIEEYGANDLQSTESTSQERYVPDVGEWKEIAGYFDLDAQDYLTIQVGLVSKSYNGNDLYLDNLSIIPDFSLETPTNFRVSDVSDGIFIFRWVDRSTNELGFIFEASEDNIDYTTLDSLAKNTTEHSIGFSDLIKNYNYARIYAFGKKGFVSGEADPIALNLVLGWNNSNHKVLIYPNTFDQVLFLENSHPASVRAEITAINGNLLDVIHLKAYQTQKIDASNMKDGVYFIKVISNDKNNIKTIKIIKRTK